MSYRNPEGSNSLEHSHTISAGDGTAADPTKPSPNMTFRMTSNADADPPRVAVGAGAAEKRRKKKNTFETKKENESPAKETIAPIEALANEGNGETMKIILPKRLNTQKDRKEAKGKGVRIASQSHVVFNAVDTKTGELRKGSSTIYSNGDQSQRNAAPHPPPQLSQGENTTPNPSNVFSPFFAPQYYGPPFLANTSYSSTQADQDSYHSHSTHSKPQQQQQHQTQEQQSWSYPFAPQMQQHLGVSQLSSFYLPSAFSHSSGANANTIKPAQTHLQTYANHTANHNYNNNNSCSTTNNFSMNYNTIYAEHHGGLLPTDGIFSGRFYAIADDKKASAETGHAKPSRASKKSGNN